MALASVNAIGESIDLSSFSFNELIDLKERIDIAIWNSNEWQEVKVPQGLYCVGIDIPAGHWFIEALPDKYAEVKIGTELTPSNHVKVSILSSDRFIWENIKGEKYYNFIPDEDISSFDVELIEGDYVEINSSSVVFKPYTGKTGLGFK